MKSNILPLANLILENHAFRTSTINAAMVDQRNVAPITQAAMRNVRLETMDALYCLQAIGVTIDDPATEALHAALMEFKATHVVPEPFEVSK